MLIKYRNSTKIQCRSDFKVDSARIISNMKTLLHEMDARTEVEGNKISYSQFNKAGKRIFIFHEGEIRLHWSDMNKIRLEWEIKLNSLLFFTFLLSVIAGFLSWGFLNTNLIGSVGVGAATWVFVFILWRQWIVLQMDDLIETSCIM